MPAGDLRARARAFIEAHDLLRPGQRVAVAASGGLDSTVLLHLLRDDFAPLAVHVNHRIRPDAAVDAEHVTRLADHWGIQSRVIEVTVGEGAGRQDAARRARYAALEEAAQAAGIDAVAVGHHRDDVAETLLLHLLRGAGPAGWAAMPVQRPISVDSRVRLVRPLRFAGRDELAAYAAAAGIEWREDPSNRDASYRRAFVRQRVMPLLAEGFGADVAARLAAAAELVEAYVASGAALAPDQALEQAVVDGDGLDVEALQALPPVARRGVLLAFLARQPGEAPRSTATVREVEALIERQPGRRVTLGEVTVWREPDRLRFTPSEPPAPSFSAVVAVPGTVAAPAGRLAVEVLDHVPANWPATPLAEVVDAAALQPPVVLRTWRPGDALAPLGMAGRKQVADILSERGVPPADRAAQLVLTASGEVVWVVGHRLAHAARITPATRRAARLSWAPGG